CVSPLLPGSFVARISLRSFHFPTSPAEAANAPPLGFAAGFFRGVGRDGVSLVFPDHPRRRLETSSRNFTGVARRLGACPGRGISFSDAFHHRTLAAGLAQPHATRFCLSSLRLV